jgi:hypothetical protein
LPTWCASTAAGSLPPSRTMPERSAARTESARRSAAY